MARYKETTRGQGLLLPVDLSEQLIPGTYEDTLNHLLDSEIDLSIFDLKYKNDFTGAPAIEPRILLKIILYCYYMGVISSRKIAALCRSHMIVKALAEDTEPHYTTLSDFVSGMGGEIENVFVAVLMVCDELKLLGGKKSALDGCRLPSNASKEYSGTKEELQKKYERLKKLCRKIIAKHQDNDKLGQKEKTSDLKKLEKLRKKAKKVRDFLTTHEDRTGAGGEIIKSNITDTESGTIKGPHGVIQGYNGIAVADSKNQVILAAHAYGSVAEGQFFGDMVERTEENLCSVTGKENPLKGTILLGDNAYFSEDNLQLAKEKGIEAVIPDEQARNRDEELQEGERRKGKEKFDSRHFSYKKRGNYYICPNGKQLVFKGRVQLSRNEGDRYESKTIDCRGCPYMEQCIRSKKGKKYRTLYIPVTRYEENLCQKMREKIDTPKYKKLYSQRMGIIEPVFANITYCKGLTRFGLRGEEKVSIQWQLYCIVHNIGKCTIALRAKKARKAA
jgi:transposase